MPGRTPTALLALTALTAVTLLCYNPSLLKLVPPVTTDSSRRAVTNQTGGSRWRRIPNVLVAGAQKAGTTYTTSWLNMHDGVCFPRPLPDQAVTHFGDTSSKELHFFDSVDRFRLGIDFFRSRWEHCRNSTYIIDGTPNYLKVPERVRKTYDEQGTTDKLRIIIILREPVSREVSRYQMMVRIRSRGDREFESLQAPQGATRSFEDYVNIKFPHKEWKKGRPSRDILRRTTGVYVTHLKGWFEAFDRKHILVLSFDELIANPRRHFSRIHRFLGLSGNMTVFRDNDRHRNSGSKSDVKPPCSVQKRLAQLLEPFNEALYELLDKNPGPEMEARPFPRFKPPCIDEA